MKKSTQHIPGFTLRACLAALAGIVVVTLVVQFSEALEGSNVGMGANAVPLPAMFIYVPLLLVCAGFYALTRRRILTSAELWVVVSALFLATPLVSTGFWTMMIGAIGAFPRTADFETYDAWPKALWPHGANLLADALDESAAAGRTTAGRVTWEPTEYEHGITAAIPVLENLANGEQSRLRFRIPVRRDAPNGAGVVPGEPYLVTALLRPDGLQPDSYYYCRVYYDDEAHFATEAFSARAAGEVNCLHQRGFLRRGMYGLTISRAARDHVEVEFGLSGPGRLALAETELVSVGTLDAIYRGRRVIMQSRFEALGEPPATELLVQPDNLWSWDGLRYIAAGYIPWRDWARPFLAWTSFAFLCLAGTWAIVALLRRQWIESERYPLPMTRIPLYLLGESEEGGPALAGVWRNRALWAGYGLALAWCLMKGWHAFNTNVPDMNIEVELTPYFTDPGWGRMWYGFEVRNITFAVSALFVSVAIFMELNVLMSLVLGFFLFRCQYWFGEATGLALNPEYPFHEQQQVGAYIAYALLILFFSRKYLWRTFRAALTRPSRDGAGEGLLSARANFALLALCAAGIVAWATWVGIPVRGMVVLFAALLMIGLVAAKVRAECGTVMACFTPVNMMQLVPVAGGMALFGPAGVLFISVANWIIFRAAFFLLPGMQLELIETSRRFRLPPRHIVATGLLGILGGLVLGGWVFLSLGYAIGGDNYGERYPYMDKAFLANDYHTAMAEANAALLHESADAPKAARTNAAWAGYGFAAAVTAVLTVLRQVFSGFWFHPVGFIVGSTVMMEFVWGSVLTAFVIRAVTLKLGGAMAVRRRLMPFFVGVFLASLTAYALFGLVNVYLYFFHPSVLRGEFTF